MAMMPAGTMPQSGAAGFDFDDDEGSRRHACLKLRGGLFWLSDAGSAGGTRLDGKDLEPGQEVQLQPSDKQFNAII